VDLELLIDRADVGPHGIEADVQGISALFIRLTADEALENFVLTLSKLKSSRRG
jgi:hypothetical protein